MSAAVIADAGDAGELIFQWERRAYSRWRLALMLVLSLLAHAASFYVLQVAYTPTGSLLPPPAQVVLVPPGSPANASLAHWIDMSDPALMTQPRSLSAGQVLDTLGFHYVPSYATVLQVFKPLPAEAPAEVPPQTRKPGPVPAGLLPPLGAPAQARVTTTSQTPAGSQTHLVWTGDISALLPRDLPPVTPPANRGTTPLERTVFLVGVPPAGGAPWLFEQGSSGDATENGADAAARGYLARLRFKAPAETGATGPVWGWATFAWGRDAYP